MAALSVESPVVGKWTGYGKWSAAADAYRAALTLVSQESEQRFLTRRLAEMEAAVWAEA